LVQLEAEIAVASVAVWLSAVCVPQELHDTVEMAFASAANASVLIELAVAYVDMLVEAINGATKRSTTKNRVKKETLHVLFIFSLPLQLGTCLTAPLFDAPAKPENSRRARREIPESSRTIGSFRISDFAS
jgi:hypothetical protein